MEIFTNIRRRSVTIRETLQNSEAKKNKFVKFHAFGQKSGKYGRLKNCATKMSKIWGGENSPIRVPLKYNHNATKAQIVKIKNEKLTKVCEWSFNHSMDRTHKSKCVTRIQARIIPHVGQMIDSH